MFSSNGSLPAETSSHPCSWELWWEDAAVLGERRGSVDFLEFLTQLIWGYVLLLKTYQKVILSLPTLHTPSKVLYAIRHTSRIPPRTAHLQP